MRILEVHDQTLLFPVPATGYSVSVKLAGALSRMAILPISFPTERERQRRLIEADQGLSFRERVQVIDGLVSLIDHFQVSDEIRANRERFALAEQTEKQRCLHEFVRQQLAAQAERHGTPD